MAVQIDIRKHKALSEEFYDGLVSDRRRKEKSIQFESVKADLVKRARLRA